MYVICDNSRLLCDAQFFRGSMTHSILSFINLNPQVKSFNVYRDVSARGKLSSSQFICSFNEKQILKFASTYLSSSGRSSK